LLQILSNHPKENKNCKLKKQISRIEKLGEMTFISSIHEKSTLESVNIQQVSANHKMLIMRNRNFPQNSHFTLTQLF
jgi:hypothetical protein